MFKCCVCKSSSKESSAARTKSKSDDERNDAPSAPPKTESPKPISIVIKLSDQESSPTIKLNGNVLRTEEVSLSPTASESGPILCGDPAPAIEDSREDGEADVETNKSPELTKQPTEASEDRQITEDKPGVDKLDNPAEDRAASAADGNTSISPGGADQRSLKTNLYDASAYIERTIEDGPEEEGDDSVFEACPTESDTRKNQSIGTCEDPRVSHGPGSLGK